jgi:hypothetical protein
VEKVVYLAMASADRAAPDALDVVEAARGAFASERYRSVSVQLPRPDVEDARRRARGVVLQHLHAGDSYAARPRERLAAVVSLWVDCADDCADAEAFLASLGDSTRGYAVTEAVKRWNVDAKGNGPPDAVTALTVMRPAPGTTPHDLLRHWRDVHMPMSLRIHPQWSYVRNVVVRSLSGEVDVPVGIAEQGFAHPDDLVDAHRFYGAVDDESFAANRSAILADVPTFLDVETTETYVTEEHVVRRAFTPIPTSVDQGTGGP